MPRPEKFEDLPEYTRETALIAAIEPSAFMLVSEPMLRALTEVLAVAWDEGLTVARGGEIRMPLSDEMKSKVLAAYQVTWDRRQQLYDLAMSDPWGLGPWEWAMVDNHAEDEGLPKVERPDAEEGQDA